MEQLRMPTLRGHSVLLRAFEARDAPLIEEAATDRLIPLITTVQTQASQGNSLAYIARQHDRLRTRAGYSFAIEEGSGAATGQIGLWLDNVRHGRASIGYWIAASRRRQGLALSALKLLTEWGLQRDGIARVELYIEPWNLGSWRTAERAGYVREGLLRQWQEVGDERRDMYMYSRLRSDI